LKSIHGFTLVEVLIAAGVLSCGLVAAASVFSFAVRVNVANRQMAVAAALVRDRMEEFRACGYTDPVWSSPEGEETLAVDGAGFARRWEIDGTDFRVVTVIVYAVSNAITGRRTELMRATSIFSPEF
jgi:prepilin-type N-terminal cleavage/methylation domain-containing protein